MNRQAAEVFWKGADWWWVEGASVAPLQYADFACDVETDTLSAYGWIALSCGSWLTLWVNGQWIYHGPPREVAPWQYYDVLDLSPYLLSGSNFLRLRVWHIGKRTQSHEPCLAGVLLKGKLGGISLDDKRIWRAALCESQLPDPPQLHPCAGFGEHVDLQQPQAAWLTSPVPDAWGPPAVVARHPLPGRERLIPSDLPQFTGSTFKAHPLHQKAGQQVWDFGEEVFGFIELELSASRAVTCDILHGESLEPTGLPDYQYAGGDFRDRLELPVGTRRWDSFEKRALRYLALPDAVKVHHLAIREYQRPLEEIWQDRAESLPVTDQKILAAAARTVRLCCDDLLNDCPRRERGQYNDPAVYGKAFPLLFGTWAPYRRWLRQYLRGADAEGVLRMCYPSSPHQGVIPDFSISFARSVLDYTESTGDLETARMAYPAALSGVASFEKFADGDGLLCNVPGWVFLCNSFELAKHPRSAGLNALWASAWESLSVLAKT
ncbi:hypothetical protein P0Y35_06790 [Kiritimatiellaeota bacterium B1221]|nr:hypothetical protein [Kiritimatiellaeota bacterium B1221]